MLLDPQPLDYTGTLTYNAGQIFNIPRVSSTPSKFRSDFGGSVSLLSVSHSAFATKTKVPVDRTTLDFNWSRKVPATTAGCCVPATTIGANIRVIMDRESGISAQELKNTLQSALIWLNTPANIASLLNGES